MGCTETLMVAGVVPPVLSIDNQLPAVLVIVVAVKLVFPPEMAIACVPGRSKPTWYLNDSALEVTMSAGLGLTFSVTLIVCSLAATEETGEEIVTRAVYVPGLRLVGLTEILIDAGVVPLSVSIDSQVGAVRETINGRALPALEIAMACDAGRVEPAW